MDDTKMSNVSIVRKQYGDTIGLDTRKSFHEKHSTNRQGYMNWIFDKFSFFNGCRILELGAGKGDLWSERVDKIGENSSLILSDYSDSMVEIMREKYMDYNHVTVRKIDVQEIPYEDASFDIVIANSMLYHVPKLRNALSEIVRVMKKNGAFYASTFGENGISAYINTTLSEMGVGFHNISNVSFTLQNGGRTLSEYFSQVKRLDYNDSFKVRESEDLVDYIYSMGSMVGLDTVHRMDMIDFYDNCKNSEGCIEIKKEYGLFIAKNM